MEVPEQPLLAATFEELAMPLFDQLYNFARWLTQDTAEAEDLVQETYTKALRGFSSFQAGTNFRAWMYRILRNSFLSSRTGLKTMVAIDEEADENLLPAESTTPESILIAQADRGMVQQALTELPVPFREILLLCEVEEMSYQENCGNACHSDRHGDVALVPCTEGAARLAAEAERGRPRCGVSNGLTSSMATSMANWLPPSPAWSENTCERARPALLMRLNECK
jgi:RNA polymerase sigma-70 factor, ECF subfamily